VLLLVFVTSGCHNNLDCRSLELIPSLHSILFEFLRYFSIMLKLDEMATLLVVNSNSLLLEQIKSTETLDITSFKS